MKTLPLSLLFLISISYARENPFESTEIFQKRSQFLSQQQLIKEVETKVETTLMESKSKNIVTNEVSVKNIPTKSEEKENNFLVKEGCKEYYFFQPLPFVKIETFKDRIVFSTREKYQLKNQEINKFKNKFLFDFGAKIPFFTRFQDLCHNYFKSITIGSHSPKGYFRVVVSTTNGVETYEEEVDAKNSVVTIRVKK